MFEKEIIMIIISKQVSNILKYNEILKLKAMRNHAIIIERKTRSCLLDYIFKESVLCNSRLPILDFESLYVCKAAQ